MSATATELKVDIAKLPDKVTWISGAIKETLCRAHFLANHYRDPSNRERHIFRYWNLEMVEAAPDDAECFDCKNN
jgi:hypothetical protein